jgi:hypothetical protein
VVTHWWQDLGVNSSTPEGPKEPEMRTRQFLPLLLLVAIACVPPVTTTVTRTSDTLYAARPTDCDIRILTQLPPNSKFVEIAILNTLAMEPAYGKDLNAMLPSIREAACRLGADAVLLRNVEAGSPYGVHSTGKVFSVAIKFIE